MTSLMRYRAEGGATGWDDRTGSPGRLRWVWCRVAYGPPDGACRYDILAYLPEGHFPYIFIGLTPLIVIFAHLENGGLAYLMPYIGAWTPDLGA